MNAKSFLLFIGGLVVGGATGFFGSMKYFQNKYQNKYEEDYRALEEYYKRTDEYSRTFYEKEYENEDQNEVNPIETDSIPNGRMSQEERNDIKKKLNQNWAGTTNYASMYKERNDPDQNYEKLDMEEVESPEEEAFDEHQNNKNKPPKIISAETYSELPATIDQEVLYLYAYDEVLCDENEEMIEEPERLIGDALTKFDFVDSDERIIFVMNYELDTCYEIQKVDASWTDTH